MPTILSRCNFLDIFNADEFGFSFQALPNRTPDLKGEKCTGSKHRKVRLTGMSTASATGEKLLFLVIGKSKNLRCFKNVKSLPCMYKAQEKIRWTQISSRNESNTWIENFWLRIVK